MVSLWTVILTIFFLGEAKALIPPELFNATYGRNPQDRPGMATDTHSCDRVRPVPRHLRSHEHMWPKGLDRFYQKYTEAYGLPVLGSSKLSDEALRRACYTVRFLFADRPDVRQAYYEAYGRFAIMATTEVTRDIPEHSHLPPRMDTRARGLGATLSGPICTGGEENALCLSKDGYRREDILLHEFVHGVHLLGVKYADPTFDARLKAQYNRAKAQGLWRRTYALTNHIEYFAEGAQSFFNVNDFADPPNGIHNDINTNTKLRRYDPGLYKLVQEVFPCFNPYLKRCWKSRAGEQTQNLKNNCEGRGIGPEECKDKNKFCEDWTKKGECGKNPNYMLNYCKKSCQVC